MEIRPYSRPISDFCETGFYFPQLLVQSPQQARQIPVAQRVAQRERPRRFVPRANGGHVRDFQPAAVAGEQAQLFHLVVELARMGADAADQFRQRFPGYFLLAQADGRAGRDFRPFRPVAVIHRPAGKGFDRPDFIERFEKGFALVHLARADEQAHALPGKLFQFLGQFVQCFRDGLRRRGAFVAEKIAVAQPDDLAGAKKRQRLQRFAQAGEGGERLAAVGPGGLDGFVVHASQLVAPLLVQLFGAGLDGEFVVAANKGKRWGFGGGHFIRVRCRFH